jgi:general secretion pathway protein G
MRSFCVAHRTAAPGALAQGFTLLELLVVIVIIGMLASYVGPKYFAQIGKSEVTSAKAQIEALSKALDTYRLDVGHYPAADEGLNALMVRPVNGANGWNGPYLKKAVPKDPWGNPYASKFPVANGDFQIMSYGKDGRAGGTGEDADLVN